jgi:uncharacterized repeat protein (TIGR01451 family)
VILFTENAMGQTAPGTIISNQAGVSYLDPGGAPVSVQSNPVDTVTVATRTVATLRLNRITAGGSGIPVGPTACMSGGGVFTPAPDPVVLGGIVIDPNQPQSLAATGQYHAGEPLFITLSDLDQNLDLITRDTIEVTVNSIPGGDSETLQLTETDINSGLFAGYVQTATGPPTADDCLLQVSDDGTVNGLYQDPNDAVDTDQAQALVDPLNIVFDSATGNPVDGITIRLVDAVTGTPATVFGADGVASFPATITTGDSITDSGGQVYAFPPGGFRFPVVPAGDYRLEIDPLTGYQAPSGVSPNVLQGLPGAPFSLDDGSYGTAFSVGETFAFNLDLPLDPSGSLLYLQKNTGSASAAPGDFVQYTLRVENISTVVQTEVTITDLLPVGFRLMPGSTYADDAPAPDPTTGPDGRSLSFDVGNLAPGNSMGIRYVTEVTVGATGETATNIALASSSTGAQSNEARATLQLVEDLFTSEATLVGRTIVDSCDANIRNDINGLEGIRIYMEDGRYAVTDEGGRFHFEGLKPGTHVVQLDMDTVPEHLEVFDCQNNSRFAGRNFSRFVNLRAGSLWRTDFHLRERPLPAGNVALELSGKRVGADTIQYQLDLDGGGLPVDGLTVTVVLPKGLTYMPGTSVIGGQSSDGPDTPTGTVSFRLGDKPENWHEEILLRANVTGDVDEELLAKAVASFHMPNGESDRTPVAENRIDYLPELNELHSTRFVPHFASLSARLTHSDKRLLADAIAGWEGGKDVVLIAEGHTDAIPIEPGHIRFADNNELSVARAASVATFVAEQLDIPVAQIQISGHGPNMPVADNDTDAGRAQNRRVDLRLERKIIIRPAGLGHLSHSNGPVNAPTLGTHEIAAVDEIDFDIELTPPQVFSEPGFIETLQPDTRWLAPIDKYSPPIPSIKIAIQHDPDDIVELSINGIAVDPLNFVGTEINRGETVAISRWRGVNLQEGNNRLSAVISNPDRSDFQTLKTTVHYGGGPVRAVLDKETSRLVADGTTPPVIAVRLFDRYGEPARPSTTGAFSVDPPHRSLWEIESLTENQLVAVGDREPLYRVGPDGIAFLKLEPTTITGEATIRLKYAGNREQELRVWIKPAPRDWILVGFAEGTLGYNTLKDNMMTAADSGFDDGTYTDGRMSFFTKGQVKGEFLLTLAYDSDVDKDKADNQLFGTIDPNRYYSLYGDTTEQRFEAASRRGLFLKIERHEFYTLFGDYQTGLSVTELSRYDRSLNGLKSEYRGEHFAYNAFASDTNKAFIRDEIIGDGTSGPFRLSSSPIVVNGDQIELQTRDRFRSEVILETRPLTRYIDYSIDYQTGTIIMKRPVPSRDQNFNPIYIVANYETPESMGENLSAGGRGAWSSDDGRLEIGASLIHQGTEGDTGNLLGTDLRFALGEQTELRAEIAATDTDLAGNEYGMLAAVDHQGETTEARLWFQELATGFGLGQQNGSETGMRKYGIDGRFGWTEQVSLVGSAFRQDNLVDNARQDVVEAELQYQDRNRNAALGLITARDDFSNGENHESNQVFLSGSTGLFDDLLTLRGSAETGLGGNNGSTNYPDRLLLGMDYQLTDAALMFTEVETARGSDWDSLMTRVGVRTQPWQNAQLNSGVNHEMTEFGPRTFATVGLTQGWQMSEKWYLDFGLDQSRSIGDQPRRVNPDAPPASGNITGEDFIASYIGALYRNEFWTFTSRAEYRDSDSENHMNLLGGFYREQIQGHGFSANLQWLQSDFSGGGSSALADLQLGWSWRPSDSEWIVYDRFDVIYESSDNPLGQLTSWKLVNNLNANWMINLATQLELQYGGKFVRSNIDSQSYTGYTDVIGAGLRRDLNDRWDVGIHGDMLHSWKSDVATFSWGLDVGMTLFENVWISMGYNFAGFRDDDFSGSNYTAQGPFLTFRIKADQKTLKELANITQRPRRGEDD